jgi:hypothetical protein
MLTSYITVLIGILVPSFVIVAITIRVCIMRRANQAAAAGGGSYSQVQHSLDEEEIEFKRMFERQSDNIDDIFGDGAEGTEVSFDTRDLDRLHMLEKYRDSLVSGDENDDGETEQVETSEFAKVSDADDIRV